MKTNQEIVLEYIQRESYKENKQIDFTTREVAQALNLQRTNASAILNELVRLGELNKTETRPVKFYIDRSRELLDEQNPFEDLIGYSESLRKSIQLSQAAILYPKNKFSVLLRADTGVGKTTFVEKTFEFAKLYKKIHNDKQLYKLNMNYFPKNKDEIEKILFSDSDITEGYFYKAQGSILFIDNIQNLPPETLRRIIDYIETNAIKSTITGEFHLLNDVFLILGLPINQESSITQKLDMIIELPNFSERSINEQFELCLYFFKRESNVANRPIKVMRDVFEQLFSSHLSFNIKELKYLIKTATAKAYVRVVDQKDEAISVMSSDFDLSQHQKIMRAHKINNELNNLIGTRNFLLLVPEGFEINTQNDANNMYGYITQQYNALQEKGIDNSSIYQVIQSHIYYLLEKYQNKIMPSQLNIKQLSKIVSIDLIKKIETIVEEVKATTKVTIDTSMFYGLCLHINSLLNSTSVKTKVIDNEQIMTVISDHPEEYNVGIKLADELYRSYGIKPTLDEKVLMAMFFIKPEEMKVTNSPVLLYIMHGSKTADALMEVTNELTKTNKTYAYNLALDKDPNLAKEEIQDLIQNIDEGSGVIIIYDMGSIKTMLEEISTQIDVKIRIQEVPITLIGIEIARRCQTNEDIDTIMHEVTLGMEQFKRRDTQPKAIITLCHTGEGGAVHTKAYIEQYSKLGYKIIPYAISDREKLAREIMRLKKTYNIKLFVGTYDPRLMGIPYISLHELFSKDPSYIDKVLTFSSDEELEENYDAIYENIRITYPIIDLEKFKSIMPNILDKFTISYNLNNDELIGLLMHLTSLLEAIIKQRPLGRKIETERIIQEHLISYKEIVKILKPLEKEFNIVIPDQEIAIIMQIVNKI